MDDVTVIGLGPMGAAMARRLEDRGWNVTGWSRSRRHVDGLNVVESLPDAVVDADLVVLALFDGKACAEVLARIRPHLATGVPVVNTSTVGPDEATMLADLFGAAYLHAPVMGSVPSVASGALEILVGAPEVADRRVRPLLEALGKPTYVGDPRAAATIKLVAIGSLAGAVLTLREVLRQADALGVSRNDALDVLARGPLGALVDAKRTRLSGVDAAPQFTVAALAKDQALLAAASGAPLWYPAEIEAALADGAVAPGDDFVALATMPAVPDEVLAPLRAYLRGHATGDPRHFREAFLPSAHVEGLRDAGFVSWSLEDYCALFAGSPAPDEAQRARRIDSVDVRGTVATASMTLWHGADTFTDVFLLVHADGGWRIANKAYHRR